MRKKIIALMISIICLMSVFSLSACKDLYEYEYYEFGLYPQSRMKNEVSVLVEEGQNDKGYYTGSDGGLYYVVRKEFYDSCCTCCNCCNCGKKEYEDHKEDCATKQGHGKNQIAQCCKKIYDHYSFYKAEPIKWKIFSKESGQLFLFCDLIIDCKIFDREENGYDKSEIREWLNEDFYDFAFSDAEKVKVLQTSIDNSILSTGEEENPYVCKDTKDKVFLLSYEEATNSSYGMDRGTSREIMVTDFASDAGVNSRGDKGTGWWWLRSPSKHVSAHNGVVNAKCVFDNGAINADNVNKRMFGVVPAIKITAEEL